LIALIREYWKNARCSGTLLLVQAVISKFKEQTPPDSEQIASVPPSRRITLLLILALTAGTLILYQFSVRNQFVNYDDPAYVTANPYVLQGLSWSNVVWAFTATAEANWHPLTWISHMADVQFFGLNQVGHHLTNVLIHLCNVLLLFLWLRSATGSTFRSAVVAALFSVHPLNVESVAWIAERKSLLSTFFLLLALVAWDRYVREEKGWRYLLVVLLFACGLMSKPMVITFPFMLLLLDYWPYQRLASSGPAHASRLTTLVIEKIPFFALSAASAVITIYAQRSGGALGSSKLLPVGWRVNNTMYSYFVYIVKEFWPSGLAVFYPHPENHLALWKVAAALVFILAITWLVWRYRNRKYLTTGWLWYLGTMLPVIGIVQVGRQAMADRYAYIPFVGLFVMTVWVLAELGSGLKLSRSIVLCGALAALIAYASVSFRQIGYWRNSYALFTHTLEVTSRNSVAETNLGEVLVKMGHPELAISHFSAAIQITPDFSTPHYDLGQLLQVENKLGAAKQQYELTFAYSSDQTELARAHNNLGALLIQLKQPAEAVWQFDAALRIDPNEQNSLIGRGTIEYQQGALDAALQDFVRAAQISPSPVAYFWMGRVLEDKGRFSEAAMAYNATLQMAPGMQEAQTRLDAMRQKSN